LDYRNERGVSPAFSIVKNFAARGYIDPVRAFVETRKRHARADRGRGAGWLIGSLLALGGATGLTVLSSQLPTTSDYLPPKAPAAICATVLWLSAVAEFAAAIVYFRLADKTLEQTVGFSRQYGIGLTAD
jgi:hypothetical protein